jgi:Tol biopolymer transport system component
MNLTSQPVRLISRHKLIILIAATMSLLVSCSSARISYSGPQIEGVRQMHLVDQRGKSVNQLFPDIRGLGSTLIWSPDAKKVIVYLEHEGEYYFANPRKGTIGDCLTCAIDEFSAPVFSPSGKFIALSGEFGFYLSDGDGGNLERVGIQPKPGWPSWSPDERFILYSAREQRLDIYRLELENGAVQNLTAAHGSLVMDFFSPSWSPDGKQIALHLLENDLSLAVMDAQGGDLRLVMEWNTTADSFDPAGVLPAVWSPDGERLAFSARGGMDSLDIFVIEFNEESVLNLTQNPGNDWDPNWAPDGKSIVFISDRSGEAEIYRAVLSNGEPTNLSSSPNTQDHNPQWRP